MTVHVSICISTLQRHQGLARLLASIGELELPACELRVFVVNNDPADEAVQGICSRSAAETGVDTACLIEPERGVSAPRNRAIDAAIEDCDFLAFVDDDSTVTPGWLAALLSVQRRTGADVVTGPIKAAYETPPPSWIVSGRFFESPDRPDGLVLDRAHTNNVLIHADAIRRTGLRFESAFGRSGGEDTLFFRRLFRSGASIVWARDAIVIDAVPRERISPRWLIDRQRRTGMNAARIELLLNPRFATRLCVLSKGLAWMLIGAVVLISGIVCGRMIRVRGRRNAAWGKGLLLGAFGRSPVTYGP